MIPVKRTLSSLLTLLLLAASVAACGDNPVDGDEEEHSDVDGLRLILDGVEVYRVLDGQVSCQQEPCGIDVTEGDETALITIEFLDDGGDEVHADDLEGEFSLGYEIADSDIAEVEQHAEDGPWAFHVVGLQAGETKMQLELRHGDVSDEHGDFRTPPLDAANEDRAISIRVALDQ